MNSDTRVGFQACGEVNSHSWAYSHSNGWQPRGAAWQAPRLSDQCTNRWCLQDRLSHTDRCIYCSRDVVKLARGYRETSASVQRRLRWAEIAANSVWDLRERSLVDPKPNLKAKHLCFQGENAASTTIVRVRAASSRKGEIPKSGTIDLLQIEAAIGKFKNSVPEGFFLFPK